MSSPSDTVDDNASHRPAWSTYLERAGEGAITIYRWPEAYGRGLIIITVIRYVRSTAKRKRSKVSGKA